MRGVRRAALIPPLSAVLLLLAPAPSRPAGGGGGERAAVLFVADGDTVLARWRGAAEWIRLLRIDTPERREAGYGSARDALVGLVKGGEATLIFEEEGVQERDAYGRILAYLFIDGRNINIEMVRLGWSRFWTRYGEGKFAPSFRRAETEARRDRNGLWASVDSPGD